MATAADSPAAGELLAAAKDGDVDDVETALTEGAAVDVRDDVRWVAAVGARARALRRDTWRVRAAGGGWRRCARSRVAGGGRAVARSGGSGACSVRVAPIGWQRISVFEWLWRATATRGAVAGRLPRPRRSSGSGGAAPPARGVVLVVAPLTPPPPLAEVTLPQLRLPTFVGLCVTGSHHPLPRRHAPRRSQKGYTPLMWAAANGHTAAARLLLQAGAGMELKNAVSGAGCHVCGMASGCTAWQQ